MVIESDCIHVGSCKSNYYVIITTTAPSYDGALNPGIGGLAQIY
jgi:hypothetical protein